MALRIMLLNDYLGPFIIDHNDPIDINSVKQTIKRSADNDGVVFEVIVDLEFIKEGLEYLKTAYDQAGGIDALVAANLYDYDPNLRRWSLWNVFTVVFKGPIEETQIGVALEQIGVQRRILNLLNQEVDQETLVSQDGSSLPAQTIIDLGLHSKTIQRQFTTSHGFDEDIVCIFAPAVTSETALVIPGLSEGGSAKIFFIPPANPTKCDEISERIDYSADFKDTIPVENLFYQFKLKEAGTYSFEIAVKYKIAIAAAKFLVGGRATCDVTVSWYLMHGTSLNYTLQVIGTNVINVGPPPSTGFTEFKIDLPTFNYEADLNVADEIYFFAQIEIQNTDPNDNGIFGEIHLNPPAVITVGEDDFVISDPNYMFITFKMIAKTNFESTVTRAVLPHEAVQRTLQYYTNQVNCFHSTLLGRTDLGYDSDGEYSMVAITNGANIRGLTGEPATNGNPICNGEDPETLDKRKIFTSFKQLHEFFNSVACTGFGFQTIDGAPILRYEKKSFFYDKTTRILSLGKVYKPKKEIMLDKYFNAVTYGYSERIDSRNVNGIDEFNTSRNSSLPIVNSSEGLNITTRVIASGYLIEAQRRLKYKTEDGPKDDSLFAICARKDGSNWVAKKDEGYSSIQNVIDAPTGYNYDISPARNLVNWYPYLASGLQRSFSKVVKFLSGTINYFMVTTKTGQTALPENGSVDLTGVSPLWDNELYIIENVPFTREYMKLIQANPYGFIDFQDYNNVTYKGFISEIEVDPNKRQANLKLLRCPD